MKHVHLHRTYITMKRSGDSQGQNIFKKIKCKINHSQHSLPLLLLHLAVPRVRPSWPSFCYISTGVTALFTTSPQPLSPWFAPSVSLNTQATLSSHTTHSLNQNWCVLSSSLSQKTLSATVPCTMSYT